MALKILLSTTEQVVNYLPVGLRIPSAAAASKYTATFTNQTTLTVLGATHALGTNSLLVMLYDAQTPAQQIQPGGLTIHPTTFDVVVTFSFATSGRIVIG